MSVHRSQLHVMLEALRARILVWLNISKYTLRINTIITRFTIEILKLSIIREKFGNNK
jgi:hypothetical protein